LIGNARRKEEIGVLLATLCSLARVAPLGWIRVAAGKIPNEVTRMFAGTEPSFIRAMGQAILTWKDWTIPERGYIGCTANTIA